MKELEEFEKDLLALISDVENGKEAKKFLRKQGRKLSSVQKKKCKETVNKKTGNLQKGFKTGKVYKYKSKELSIRAYNKAPHAHLIDRGHRMLDKNGNEKGFVPGKNFMEKAQKDFESTQYNDTQNFIDDMIKKRKL